MYTVSMVPIDLPSVIMAVTALIAAVGAIMAAHTARQNASSLKRVETSVNGDMKRLSDHLLAARRELAEAEERYREYVSSLVQKPKRVRATRRPRVQTET